MKKNHLSCLISIGTDLEDINRFSKINLEKDRSFLKSIFTANELKYCFSKKYPAPHLAVRFSGKEAVLKALAGNVSDKKSLARREIEIVRQKSGKPEVKIKNNKFSGLEILISLSHSKNLAIAVAVVTGK